ncbi:hypothetical protein [Paenibacillus tundrae]|uniref:hypothetical protein n=1 Tax=Paenibacillus tundrae TaxID=528187 RepID=UPI0030D012B6
MKRTIIGLFSVIIASNVVWGWLYLNKVNEQPNHSSSNIANKAVQMYELNGTGDMWDVSDYKIIITPNQIQRGHASLTFKGDPRSISDSNYYKLDIQEKDPEGNYSKMLSHVATSHDGPITILNNDNLKNIGYVTSDYAYDELKKDRQNYASTFLRVTWNDNDGKLHSEDIYLTIENEIMLE